MEGTCVRAPIASTVRVALFLRRIQVVLTNNINNVERDSLKMQWRLRINSRTLHCHELPASV